MTYKEGSLFLLLQRMHYGRVLLLDHLEAPVHCGQLGVDLGFQGFGHLGFLAATSILRRCFSNLDPSLKHFLRGYFSQGLKNRADIYRKI